jgi:hypothetical protein
MIKHLCVALAAACLASAADAADLSMTPIYKSRPSAVSSLDGRLKAEYRAFTFIGQDRLDRTFTNSIADTPARSRGPTNDRAVQTGMDTRF